MTIILLGACLLVFQGHARLTDLTKQGEVNAPSLARLILSAKLQERKDAYPYAMTNMIGLHRERSKSFLLNVIRTNPLLPSKRAPDNEEDQYAPRRIALSILAEWHDPELIPVFIENIDYVAEDPNRSGLAKSPSNEYYAAVKGLINIGKPAIQPCLKELAKNENNPEVVRFSSRSSDDYQLSLYRRDNLLFVISQIVGSDETRKLLVKEIAKIETIEPTGAKNLRQVLTSPLIRAQ